MSRDLHADNKVLKKQLEAVTVAYVRQGAALQAAASRLRRRACGGTDSGKAEAERHEAEVHDLRSRMQKAEAR